MSDQWAVVMIAATWSGAVGVAGLALGWLLRRTSLRWQPLGVALVAVVAVVAGVFGTARAMFLSDHDFHVVLVVLLVAGLVAVVFAMLVGTTVVRWSRSLAEDARRFGDSGRFESAGGGPVEFKSVSDELTRTSGRLAESRAREARLEESRRELVSWVSHDLRTPLAGLRAMTEALEDGMTEEPQRYHRQMRTEVDRMVRMVDDLFELSRIHAGVIPLDVQTVELGDLVSEAIAGADPVARAKGVRLGGAVEPGVLVRADPGGLSRVVGNLVMNAIRHTPADGTVEITGRAVADGIELSVADACGGIPDDDLSRVFDVAWRGTHARTPAEDSGAGLGLAIVKGLVEAYDGRVEVHNQPPGCRFLVRLPS
ncbi:MAG: HAMP domain-containing sensor histidine kinase [Nocardioidaceae bacterium]